MGGVFGLLVGRNTRICFDRSRHATFLIHAPFPYCFWSMRSQGYTGDLPVFWMEDVPGVVQPVIHGNSCPNEVPTGGGREELDDASFYRYGIVVIDGSIEPGAEDVSDIGVVGERSPRGGGVVGFDTEAELIVGYEDGVEVVSGGVCVTDLHKFQFGDEAVLEGAVHTFGPAPCLGGVGEDEPDAQSAHGPLELSGFMIAAFYTGGGEVGGPIKVEGGGHAVSTEDLGAHGKTSLKVFVRLKDAEEGFSGGVVGGQDEG